MYLMVVRQWHTTIHLHFSEVLGRLTIFINFALSMPQIRARDNNKGGIYEHNTHLNCLQFYSEILFNRHPCFNIASEFAGAHLTGK